jgi:hypothetical protein
MRAQRQFSGSLLPSCATEPRKPQVMVTSILRRNYRVTDVQEVGGWVSMSLVCKSALETATSNITRNATCAGWVLTPLVQNQIDAIAHREKISVSESQGSRWLRSNPHGCLRPTAQSKWRVDGSISGIKKSRR